MATAPASTRPPNRSPAPTANGCKSVQAEPPVEGSGGCWDGRDEFCARTEFAERDVLCSVVQDGKSESINPINPHPQDGLDRAYVDPDLPVPVSQEPPLERGTVYHD